MLVGDELVATEIGSPNPGSQLPNDIGINEYEFFGQNVKNRMISKAWRKNKMEVM